MAVSARTGAWTATLLIAVTASAPGRAHAFSGGIVGRSGKQGTTCAACHGGGATPTVAFIGPDAVLAGATEMFRFTLQAPLPNQRAGGFNVAASDGTLAIVAGEGERRDARSGELTHSGPRLVDGEGLTEWPFLWTAPAAAGTYTLFGSGNAVNLNGKSSGDRSNTTSIAVVVVEAFHTPTASPTPPPTPTPTATLPLDTPTAVPTIGPVPCVGDCDASDSVTVNELVVGVNIALGNTALASCLPFDADGNGTVAVNEIIAAVNAALGICIGA